MLDDPVMAASFLSWVSSMRVDSPARATSSSAAALEMETPCLLAMPWAYAGSSQRFFAEQSITALASIFATAL